MFNYGAWGALRYLSEVQPGVGPTAGWARHVRGKVDGKSGASGVLAMWIFVHQKESMGKKK